MYLKWIYWAIGGASILLVISNLFLENSLRSLLVVAMVLVPLLVRAFFIKLRIV